MSDQERRAELRRFLKDRRARVSPVAAGIPATARRRVRGLRREEVAELAGIGVSWYTALESGEAEGVSEGTVLAVSEALRLSESERNYLLALTGHSAVAAESHEPNPLLAETIRALTFPAYIISASWEVLDCNVSVVQAPDPENPAWAKRTRSRWQLSLLINTRQAPYVEGRHFRNRFAFLA